MKERGFALVTVVLLMLGLAALATALGFAASQQVAVGASLHDLARARAAADGGARAAADEWDAARRSLDPIGHIVSLWSLNLEPGLRVSVSATRLSRSTWLVEANGVSARGALRPVAWRTRRLLRALDVDSVGAAYDAAIVAGRVHVEAGANVEAEAAGVLAPVDLCGSGSSPGAAIRAPAESTTVMPGSVVNGNPVLQHDPDPSGFRERLGALDWSDLVAAAAPIVAENMSPHATQVGDSCDVAAFDNWGAAEGPCAAHHVLVHADGPLTVVGGYGQGLLLSSADLVLDSGFVFRGLIIATGRVVVRDAEVYGTIAGSYVDIGSRGRVTLARCAIADALTHTPALRRPIVPPRSWLPTFE